MLKSLRQADIDAVVAASGTTNGDAQADSDLPSPEQERVYAIVEQLSREAQEELLALMWTGGPKNGNSFADNLELAHKTRDENHAIHIAEQHTRLPVYLKDGLARMSAEKT